VSCGKHLDRSPRITHRESCFDTKELFRLRPNRGGITSRGIEIGAGFLYTGLKCLSLGTHFVMSFSPWKFLIRIHSDVSPTVEIPLSEFTLFRFEGFLFRESLCPISCPAFRFEIIFSSKVTCSNGLFWWA
jgi:hypothetical protein